MKYAPRQDGSNAPTPDPTGQPPQDTPPPSPSPTDQQSSVIATLPVQTSSSQTAPTGTTLIISPDLPIPTRVTTDQASSPLLPLSSVVRTGTTAIPSTTSSDFMSSLPFSQPVFIGIIAGGAAFLIAIIVLVILLCKRRRSRKQQPSSPYRDNFTDPETGPPMSSSTSTFASGMLGGGNKPELTPPPTPKGNLKALKADEKKEKKRDKQALNALVQALDIQAEKQSAENDWNELQTGSNKRQTLTQLPPVEVFKAALAPKS